MHTCNVKQSNSAGKRAKKNHTFNIHNVTIIRLPPTTQANCSFVRYWLSSSEYQLIYMNHTAKNINEMIDLQENKYSNTTIYA